jgi:hypothetical protein
MHDPAVLPEASPRSFWKRRGCLVGLLLAAGLAVGTVLFLVYRSDSALRQAEAEADSLDPGWRLEDLEAKRVRPPDADNSALRVLAVKRLLPTNGWKTQLYTDLFQDLPPEAQLNAEQVKALKAAMQAGSRARSEGRKLADMPDGYFVIVWSPDFWSTNLSAIQEPRDVAAFLKDDALLRAQEGDADGAVRSLQAALNAGRSVGTTPIAIA